MDFLLKVMNFLLKMLDFLLKTLNEMFFLIRIWHGTSRECLSFTRIKI